MKYAQVTEWLVQWLGSEVCIQKYVYIYTYVRIHTDNTYVYI